MNASSTAWRISRESLPHMDPRSSLVLPPATAAPPPAALALLLGTDLAGSRERGLERCRDRLLANNLAPDVADNPAEPRAQDAQLATVAVELLGEWRVAIRTASCRRALAGQAAQSLDPRVQQLGVVGKLMALGCTVVSTVTRLTSLVRSAPLSWATRKLSASSISSLSPSRLRQWLRS